MKEKDRTHWAMQEIADEEAAGSSIDLWSRIEARLTSSASQTRGTTSRKRKQALALGFVLVIALMGFLFVRAQSQSICRRSFSTHGHRVCRYRAN